MGLFSSYVSTLGNQYSTFRLYRFAYSFNVNAIIYVVFCIWLFSYSMLSGFTYAIGCANTSFFWWQNSVLLYIFTTVNYSFPSCWISRLFPLWGCYEYSWHFFCGHIISLGYIWVELLGMWLYIFNNLRIFQTFPK